MFPFLWVPELSPYISHSNFQLTNFQQLHFQSRLKFSTPFKKSFHKLSSVRTNSPLATYHTASLSAHNDKHSKFADAIWERNHVKFSKGLPVVKHLSSGIKCWHQNHVDDITSPGAALLRAVHRRPFHSNGGYSLRAYSGIRNYICHIIYRWM
jgi:hypothetical protein